MHKLKILALPAFLVICASSDAIIGKPEPIASRYVVGIRLKGPFWKANLDTPEGRQMIRAHGEVIRKMEATGKLIAAGPFADPTDLRGLLLFRDCTLEEARRMASEDPVVQSGQITIEYHTWMARLNLKSE